MTWPKLLPLAIIVSGCAAVPPAPVPVDEPAGREWSDGHIQQDVESSVRERFGAAAYDRALAAEASVMTKVYRGLPVPPVLQPDGSWREQPHPVALLLRENGKWMKVRDGGVDAIRAVLEPELTGLLASAEFWAEPARVPQGGCTDGGSTLLVIRMPRRGAAVRQGTCGGPPLHNRMLALSLSE